MRGNPVKFRYFLIGFAVSALWLLAVLVEDAKTQEEAGGAHGYSYGTVASCYGYELAGSPMANGVPFDPEAMTTAHRTLPFGTVVAVSYGYSTVYVTVTDRGPFVYDREFDLSCGAMAALGLPPGVYPISVSF